MPRVFQVRGQRLDEVAQQGRAAALPAGPGAVVGIPGLPGAVGAADAGDVPVDGEVAGHQTDFGLAAIIASSIIDQTFTSRFRFYLSTGNTFSARR